MRANQSADGPKESTLHLLLAVGHAYLSLFLSLASNARRRNAADVLPSDRLHS